MAVQTGTSSQAPARLRYSRAFRPLSYWLLISAGLLAFDYHQRHAPRTTLTFAVRIDGKTIADPLAYSATAGKYRVASGSVAPIGRQTLRVALPDAEPVEKSVFIWYGENEADDVIDLKWHRGVLDLKIEPTAKLVRLVGPHHRFSLTNSSGTTVSIPVGTYRVETVFERLSEEQQVRVGHNETNRFVIKPNLGTVSVSSEPTGAKFRLSAEDRIAVSTEGLTPAVIVGLPTGAYTLRAWRDDYVKEMVVDVRKWETNHVTVPFEYGEVKVVSDPAGATIFHGDRELGQTPKTLSELKPGPYRLRLEKPGYTSVEFNFELLGTNAVTIATNLVTVRYAEAIANARREAASLSPNYRRALVNIEVALKEKPGDAEALALKAELQVALGELEQREALQKQRAELEARKRSAGEAFERATKEIRQVELFDTHRWEFQATGDKVHAALLQTFKGPPAWTVQNETKAGPDTILFYCKPKGLLVLGRQCVVLASQVDTNEVHVYAKFWDYALSTKVTINIFKGGVDPESLIPINKNYFPPEQAAAIEARRRTIAEDFYRNLQNQLR